MRHQCGNCFGEFFDDAQSSSPAERVFCVFCGVLLHAKPKVDAQGVPFSADFPREEAFALGVIGATNAGFPDTLRQFRAHGAGEAKADSLAPVHTADDAPREPEAAPWHLSKFWTSLAIGFAVGACAAVLFSERAVSRSSTAAAAPAAPKVAAAVLSGCAAPSVAAPSVVPAPVVESKPAVTPALEKRFWLERARTAQRQYRLPDAERFYRRVLSQSPRDSEALAGLGEVELLRGAAAEADARFREALRANADYLPARVALADLQWQAGQADDARREYRHIVEHYSSDLFPPYVSQRLQEDVCAPQCGQASVEAVSPASTTLPVAP